MSCSRRCSRRPELDHQGRALHLFPLSNPCLVSIPLSFLLGYLGTVLSRDRADTERSDELEVRSVTGIGAGASLDRSCDVT